MLNNTFFKIQSKELISPNNLLAKVRINPNHKIFKGHFPDQPIVPGVVSVQMINEILSSHLNQPLMTSSARSIKYISMIDPNVNPELNFIIKFSESEEGSYKVNAQITFGDTIFVKFIGTFKII